MMKILADATLPNLKAYFGAPFTLTLYDAKAPLADLVKAHDILLCRSTLKVTDRLLANSTIHCVATASSGTDHIDTRYLDQHNIALFDAKGCNARAVADYVVASLALLTQRGALGGNRAGIIGVGEVGSRVASRLRAAGLDVICFDPPKAAQDSSFHSCTLAELTTCDVICIHANLHKTQPYSSYHLLDANFLAQLRNHAIIINASRGGIVNEEALLNTKKSIAYCTDVYCNEPTIDAKIVDYSTLCTPHIAGHSIEAKRTAVIQISRQLHDYFGLPTPAMTQPILDSSLVMSLGDTWQDTILSVYNPLDDTLILKAATNKTTAFLTQRQTHTNRHDFIAYNTHQCDQRTQLLLGQGDMLKYQSKNSQQNPD